MENVQFKAMCMGLGPQIQYPNMGAEQSMVSKDLIETLGLKVEPSTKAKEAVDGGCVTCLGLSPVEVVYQGWTTQTQALGHREAQK